MIIPVLVIQRYRAVSPTMDNVPEFQNSLSFDGMDNLFPIQFWQRVNKN